MKKTLALTLTILAITNTSTAHADNSWYLGALYNTQSASEDDPSYNTAGLIAGYTYNKYLSIESRVATGTSGDSGLYGTTENIVGNYGQDIKSQVSLLIKASYPFLNAFEVYGLAGYSSTKLDVFSDYNDGFYHSYTPSNSGFGGGLGFGYKLNQQFNIFIDYQVIPGFDRFSQSPKNWKSTTIGVNYCF